MGINFIEIRIELIDHIASEFEESSDYVLLEDFLRTKGSFVKNFQKRIHNLKHWGYQKALFKRVLQFFITPQYILISLLIGSSIYLVSQLIGGRIQSYLFLITMLLAQVIHLYIYYKPKGMYKKIQSAQYILSIMALPSMFLYCAGILTSWLLEQPTYFMWYWFFALVFNVAGLLEVIECKRQIINQYQGLINA